jgi:hypothetical protein
MSIEPALPFFSDSVRRQVSVIFHGYLKYQRRLCREPHFPQAPSLEIFLDIITRYSNRTPFHGPQAQELMGDIFVVSRS